MTHAQKRTMRGPLSLSPSPLHAGKFVRILLSSADFFFSKLTFSKQSFRNTIRVSNGLDPDQDRHFVGPDLGQTICKGYQQTTKVTASKGGLTMRGLQSKQITLHMLTGLIYIR